MPDVYGGATPIVPKIAGFSGPMPVTGATLRKLYFPITTSASIAYGMFVELQTDGKIDESEAADTKILGISLGTNVTTNYPGEVAQRPLEKNEAGTSVLEVVIADENLEFDIAVTGATPAVSDIGDLHDFAISSGKAYLDIANAAVVGHMRILRLIDPIGTTNGRVRVKIERAVQHMS